MYLVIHFTQKGTVVYTYAREARALKEYARICKEAGLSDKVELYGGAILTLEYGNDFIH